MRWKNLKGTSAWGAFCIDPKRPSQKRIVEPRFDRHFLEWYFDFFDSHEIYILLFPIKKDGKFLKYWEWSIQGTDYGGKNTTRHKAEKAAFFKAFEILNERMKTSVQEVQRHFSKKFCVPIKWVQGKGEKPK